MSKAMKSDVEGGFLKPMAEAAEVVRKAQPDESAAVQSLNALVSAYAVKQAADSMRKLVESEKEEKKPKKKKSKKKRDFLGALLVMKQKGLIDDNTFKALLLASLMDDGDGFNPLTFMMMQPQQQSDEELKKEIKMLKKALKAIKAKLEEKEEEKETQKASDGNDTLKYVMEMQKSLIETLLQNNNKDPMEQLQKYADVVSKLTPQQQNDALSQLMTTVELLNKLGIVKDETKEKLLEFRKEIMEKKLETEKEIERMKLERQKIQAQSEIEAMRRQAEMINNIGNMIIKTAVKGFIEAQRPEGQKEEQQKEEQPKEEPKPVDVIQVQHVDDKGNVLHTFNIPVKVLEKNVVVENGKKYYKVICPYDNQELIFEAEEGGGENGQ